MKKNNNTFKKLKEINNYLFPNEELLLLFENLNLKIAAKIGKAILLWLIILFVVIISIIVFFEQYQYVITTIVMYIIMLFMGFNIVLINRPKKKVFKKQIVLLKMNKEKYKKEIILHNNFKKHHLKGNIIYGIIICLAMIMSINLFITDLINSGNTTLGPVFVSLVVMFVLFIPAAAVNYFLLKRYVQKQWTIINETI